MTSVTIRDVVYEIKDTLKVKEVRKVMDSLAFGKTFSDRLKAADTPEKINALNVEVQGMTATQWQFAYDTVKRCYDLQDPIMEELRNIDLLFLFSEVYKESTSIKKT